MRSRGNRRSANVRNFFGSDAGSYITGSIWRPRIPPPVLISSIANNVALSCVRSIADVTPVCEKSTPTRQFPELSSINAITTHITLQPQWLLPADTADLITELTGLEICSFADFALSATGRAPGAARAAARSRNARTELS